jgi:molybdopterin synthase catalytic subunit
MPRVVVGPEDFDLGAEAARLEVPGAGAVVTFTGVVRGGGGLRRLEIEHYPCMTERAIREIAERAEARWSLAGATVIHRHGALAPGERIMMVATAAPHRGDAFAAAEFLMDYLKSRAPFWKKEVRAEGEAWVDARPEDETALGRW